MALDPNQIPLVWTVPENAKSVYTNNVVVQATAEEVIISFFEKWPPFVVGDHQAAMQEMEKRGGMEAKLVARVTMDHKRARDLLGTLGGVIERDDARKVKTAGKGAAAKSA